MSQAPATGPVLHRYQALVAERHIAVDAAQLALVDRLDHLIGEIQRKRLAAKSSSLGWLFSLKDKREAGIRGLYIHGKVGRGKSMLMDIFFDLAPSSRKRRVHFNEFMAETHDLIHKHRKAFEKGEVSEADPIKPVGRKLAAAARLLCFDEFSVTDIADAMILGRLFRVLFDEGTVVVATSNVAPDDLYHDGLNRQLFLPFIAMLKEHCRVFELDAPQDFRLDRMAGDKAYFSPIGAKSRAGMEAMWQRFTAGKEANSGEIVVKGRKFAPLKSAGDAAWFTFDQLCGQPHGAADYLAIARKFRTIFVEGVPMMGYSRRNEAKRFILLIDTLYDSRLTAVISAQANPHVLYTAGTGNEIFEFQRTASRLIEMQSEEYVTNSAGTRTGEASKSVENKEIY